MADSFGGDKKHKIKATEQLNRKNRLILTYAKYLWDKLTIFTRNGKIMARKEEENSKLFQIKST